MINVQSKSIKTEFTRVFEYDFRWKSVAQMQSVWFEFFRWSTSNIQFTSYWISWIRDESVMPMWKYTNSTLISKIRNAKKITLTMIANPSSTNALWYRMYRIADYNNRLDVTWIYTDIYWLQTHIYWAQYDDRFTASWSRTVKCEIDFVAKKLTSTDSAWWFSRTWTLSDTQIQNIKGNSNWIYDNIWYWNSSWIQSIKIEIK